MTLLTKKDAEQLVKNASSVERDEGCCASQYRQILRETLSCSLDQRRLFCGTFRRWAGGNVTLMG